MTGLLRVDPAVLEQTSAGLAGIATELGNTSAAPALRGAAGPLSGLDAALACQQVASAVENQSRQLGTDLSGYAENLQAAAEAYRRGDAAAADRIEGVEPEDRPADEAGDHGPDDGYHPVSADELRRIVPELTPERAEEIVGPLNDAMRDGGMDTPERQAAFISQLAVESDRFRTFEEYASGSEYEGRADLGNTEPGDGERYKGRGAIQVTGRYNYTRMSEDLGVDFVNHPELAARPEYAFKSALWYWNSRNGNAVADGGDIVKITEMVNGGHYGLAERTDYYNRGLQVLGE
ncbi:hypothetical protein KIH27_04200 [Mycobacterium sp. M1]|uniref:Glycoside hydrolase family 19 catalytic domain-containing protein n=1 Tax=Mycolicibacter acidiphilus TaxID=2835306 RepID=A0ABS5REU2_9MYCO|nr:glycoside hydrolase family 19 protein [Mycolicibacter acidiphilus]MBS9532788.1 hypothetical protein [Mycolicibacter acidiphilus]